MDASPQVKVQTRPCAEVNSTDFSKSKCELETQEEGGVGLQGEMDRGRAREVRESER